MYETKCYKKPFLKEVIFRLDFGTPVESLSRALPPAVANAALKRFPIAEQQKTQSHQIILDGVNSKTNIQEATQSLFHGKNREKTVTINAHSLVVQHRQYDTFEGFYEDVDSIVKIVFESEKELSVARLGLRYVNIIDRDGDVAQLSWDDYIDPNLLGIIAKYRGDATLSRVFHIVEFNAEGQYTRFQYGIPNPDYPAPIKRGQFVLDIDSSFSGALSYEDTGKHFKSTHDRIQQVFEESITEKLRERMQEVKA